MSKEEEFHVIMAVDETGRELPLHNHVMERELGRPLEFLEVVKHLDGDWKNNMVENLKIEHVLLDPEDEEFFKTRGFLTLWSDGEVYLTSKHGDTERLANLVWVRAHGVEELNRRQRLARNHDAEVA